MITAIAVELLRGPFSSSLVCDGGGWRKWCFLFIVVEAPDFLWLPKMEEGHGRDNRHRAGHDVHQVAVNVVRPEELRESEGETDDQNGGEPLQNTPTTPHRDPH